MSAQQDLEDAWDQLQQAHLAADVPLGSIPAEHRIELLHDLEQAIREYFNELRNVQRRWQWHRGQPE